MKAKNILFIIPEMSMGGAQRSLSSVSNEMALHYNVWIVVFNRNYVPAFAPVAEVLSLDVVSGSTWMIKSIAFIRRVWRLREIKAKLKIDVAISFLEGADYVNILSKKNERVILSIRGSKVYDENMLRQNFFLRRKLIKVLYKKASMIVFVNKGIANELTAVYKLHSVPRRIIYNFYDLKEIQQLADHPLSDRMHEFCQHPVMAMSGRLAIEKGQAFVIGIFAELKQTIPKLKLLLIGDGLQRESLLDLIASLGLKTNYLNLSGELPDVFITGELKNVFNHLKHSCIYILNSSSEGFPNGLAEAMACGLPVVAADCPYGPREILAPDTPGTSNAGAEFATYGILLPRATRGVDTIRQIWVDTLTTILTNDQIRVNYAERAVERMSHFSRDKIIPEWREAVDA